MINIIGLKQTRLFERTRIHPMADELAAYKQATVRVHNRGSEDFTIVTDMEPKNGPNSKLTFNTMITYMQ